MTSVANDREIRCTLARKSSRHAEEPASGAIGSCQHASNFSSSVALRVRCSVPVAVLRRMDLNSNQQLNGSVTSNMHHRCRVDD